MTQQLFENTHETLWRQLEVFLANPRNKDLPDDARASLPEHYRHVCHHLAIAKHRRYSPFLVDRLNAIVVGCHNLLYAGNARFRYQWLRFLVRDFPDACYQNRAYIRWATFLFCFPLFAMGLLCYFDAEMIYSVMPWDQVRNMESMYDPGNSVLGRERESSSDLMMFGFYIYNNIGIAFREFAGGILLGLFTILILIYNGVAIGAVAGHLTQLGYLETFYPFVIGHGAFELTGIVLSAAAGMRIGVSLISPGNLSRWASLRQASKSAVQVLLGAAVMLLIAAFIEAFWSSKAGLPIPVKLTVGVFCWVLVLGYLTLAGRRNGRGETWT